MDTHLDDVELSAWRGLLTSHARIVRALDHELIDEEALSLSQYEVLLHLSWAEAGSVRMSELASKVLLSPSGITRVVDHLERKGLVERLSCPTDRRGSFATLTDKGKERLRRAAPVHVRGIREHFSQRLSPEELTQLASILGRLQGSPDD
jgi:DNA-binding MarR family transcriptional regulator